MPKLLYESELTPDSRYGSTTDAYIIFRNRKILEVRMEKLTGVEILPAGRYVCISSSNDNGTKLEMMFFEFNKDIDFV